MIYVNTFYHRKVGHGSDFLKFCIDKVDARLSKGFYGWIKTLVSQKKIIHSLSTIQKCISLFRSIIFLEYQKNNDISIIEILQRYVNKNKREIQSCINALKSSQIDPITFEPLLPDPKRKRNNRPKGTNKKSKVNKRAGSTNTKAKSKSPKVIPTSTIRALPNDTNHEINEATNTFISLCVNKGDLSLDAILQLVTTSYEQQRVVTDISNQVHMILHEASGGDVNTNNDTNERFGRSWSNTFGYLTQAKGASGFRIDSGRSGRSVHDFDINKCKQWQKKIWHLAKQLIHVVNPSFSRNERFCIQVSQLSLITI